MKIVSSLFITLMHLNFSSEKEMDFSAFSMETPENWVYVKQRGIDSFVGKVALDKNDTLRFDYGLYSSSLEEDLGFIITKDSVFTYEENENKNDTVNRYVQKFYAKRDTLNMKSLYKTEYSFEVINNLKAKIVTPKKPGIGLTGVFFENTRLDGKGVRFQISGYNLSEKNQMEFLKAIRTLKFKD
jgi:hypothetical protein